jgi:hypothetical protein
MSLATPSLIGFNFYQTPYTPQNFGRPSSPLNPHASSSSPITSPTPQHQSHPHTLQHHLYPISPNQAIAGPSRPRQRRAGSLPSPASSSSSTSTRYARRPTAPTINRTVSSNSGLGLGGPLDLFTEGTSPVQGQLWRDRLGRRMEERERRKRVRENDMHRRRDIQGVDDEDQEAADKRAAEDDEEVCHCIHVF